MPTYRDRQRQRSHFVVPQPKPPPVGRCPAEHFLLQPPLKHTRALLLMCRSLHFYQRLGETKPNENISFVFLEDEPAFQPLPSSRSSMEVLTEKQDDKEGEKKIDETR